MEYYIEPAEQTPEVQAKLAEITPKSLNPEELTLLDPACGSGHILVEAYDLLKAIYQERGYRAKDIPRLILEKNLFGLEIDDRAAQLAAFALMMKARADDRSILRARRCSPTSCRSRRAKVWMPGRSPKRSTSRSSKRNRRRSANSSRRSLTRRLRCSAGRTWRSEGGISQADVTQLIELFEHGKTFGSLIRVPGGLAEKFPAIPQRVEDVIVHGGMFEKSAVRSAAIDSASSPCWRGTMHVAESTVYGRPHRMNTLVADLVIETSLIPRSRLVSIH